MDYYDLLIGLDILFFPSYYEPWGYTLTESVALLFPPLLLPSRVSGMGTKEGDTNRLDDGIEVINRNDFNYNEVVEELASLIF